MRRHSLKKAPADYVTGEAAMQVNRAPAPTDAGDPSVSRLCGPYTVECIFPSVLSNHFAYFFRTIERFQDLDLDLFTSVFAMRCRCSVTVRRDPAKAARLRSRFSQVAEFRPARPTACRGSR